MKMMLGFVAMVGVVCIAADPFGMNENQIMTFEKPRSFLSINEEDSINLGELAESLNIM